MPSYEALYPLCTAVYDRLHRFERHLVRIYGPTYRALQRIPEMYADGTQLRLAGQIYERAISGDGLVLGQRLLENSWSMMKKWKDGFSNGGGSGGSGSGTGAGGGGDNQNSVPGQDPPPGLGPPPVPPPPPAA